MAYNKEFLTGFTISLPILSSNQLNQFGVNGLNISNYILDYENYTVFQNPFRKFSYYTATNIDGSLFKETQRSGSWTKDDRIPAKHQLGLELYDANKSDFDRGHMTKREDVQWGNSIEKVKKAARSTFVYTNAVPQMAKLNRSIWRRIENYILHSEGVDNQMKLCVFTGPVLNENDPFFVTLIENEKIKIPRLFWKVIFFKNSIKELCRTAFITNQSNLLMRKKIVEPTLEIKRSSEGRDDFFLDFKDADTYQTDISVIESLSGLTFSKAKDIYKDDRIIRLILEEVDYRKTQICDIENNYKIKNLAL